MCERLRSLGLDVGTTTTQLIFSELAVENRASAFSVPEMAILERRILYKSPVFFTPLRDEAHVDGEKIRKILELEYEKAGISRDSVDTGAIIITGETARKENAQAVLEQLSDFAGDFVAATAGPDLESRLAAKGAGAVDFSAETGETVLHMDIGGGTANLALIREGEIRETGCLNIGGRLIKFSENGIISYISSAILKLTPLRPGMAAEKAQLETVAQRLAEALEMAAGLRPRTELLDSLITDHTVTAPAPGTVLSFSGGVADCIGEEVPWRKFGDMGPLLGKAIRNSRLCEGAYVLGRETVRATVIGAGCHSAQLSGSTVFYRNVKFPIKNLPVAVLSREEQALAPEKLAAQITARLDGLDGDGALALPGVATYEAVNRLAAGIAAGVRGRAVNVVLESDCAKALGHALALELPPGTPILCMDRVRLPGESFLDVGQPVGPALPVVVKTLVLSQSS